MRLFGYSRNQAVNGWWLVVLLLPLACGSADQSSNLVDEEPNAPVTEEAFVQAMMDLNFDIVQKAFREDVNPNAKNKFGDTALIWAVYRDQMPLVEELIKRGANPNFVGTYKKAPLHWAAELNMIHHIEYLLKNGAKIDIYDHEFRSPLHLAVAKKHILATRVLLENGANPNWTDSQGQTPLYVAVNKDFGKGVEMLMVAGADQGKKASNGLSPLEYAVKTDRQRYFKTKPILQTKSDISALIDNNIKTEITNWKERPPFSKSQLSKLMHRHVNLERKKEKLPALEYFQPLQTIALNHAKDMARRKFFSHENPSGKNPLNRAMEAKFEPPPFEKGERVGFGIGENLFQGVDYRSRSASVSKGVRYESYDWYTMDDLAKLVIESWLNSSGHRKNILTPTFTHQGFGIYLQNRKIWVVQNFYYPMALEKVVDKKAERPEYNHERIAQLVHDSVNKVREENGLQHLKWDSDLAAVALLHGKDMGIKNYFNHSNKEGVGPTKRAERAKYKRLLFQWHGRRDLDKKGIGENLSLGKVYAGRTTTTLGSTRYQDYHWMSEEALVAQAIEGWWKSDGHRITMLRKQWEYSGVGVAFDDHDQVYIVHNFF